jgi:hypothetical protein
VTAKHPARPLLATLICIYEIAIVLLAILARSFSHWLSIAHPSAYHPTPFSQIAALELTYVLAVFAAILLWRMHHLAAYLLTVRFFITLVFYIVTLTATIPNRPARHAGLISPTAIHWLTYVVGLMIVLLNAAIPWYVYDITSSRNYGPQVVG